LIDPLTAGGAGSPAWINILGNLSSRTFIAPNDHFAQFSFVSRLGHSECFISSHGSERKLRVMHYRLPRQ
jgi:hypothetical protein